MSVTIPATPSLRHAPNAPPPSRRVFDGLVAACCLGAIVGYVVVAFLRLRHPFELQWMEGGSVDHVRRVLEGQALYPPPSVDFVSFAYPPLYYWVCAPVAAVLGVGFLPLRLVSFVSSLATMGVLAAVGRRASGRWLPGLVAAGLFAAAFRVTGAWYDVARVDSLFVFLLVASVAVVAEARSWRGAATAGVLLALAALTKQTALLPAVPILGYLLVRRPRIGVPVALAFFLPWAAASLALQLTSAGWYRHATVDVLVGHPVEGSAWLAFPLRDIASHLGPALVLIVLAARRRPGWSVPMAGAVGLVSAAWVSRLHSGGYDGVLIPAFAGVALLVGLAVGRLAPARAWSRRALAVACLVQLGLLAYNPRAQVPTAEDVGAGRSLIAALRSVPGDVLVVSHPWYSVMAGKLSHAQAAAISDIVRSRVPRAEALLSASIAREIHRRRFAALVFDDGTDYRGFPDDLDRHYVRVPAPVLGPGEPGLRPVTDIPVRPRDWWVPRADAER